MIYIELKSDKFSTLLFGDSNSNYLLKILFQTFLKVNTHRNIFVSLDCAWQQQQYHQ